MMDVHNDTVLGNLVLKNCIGLIGGKVLPFFSAEVEKSRMSYESPTN
jgi:hypothetical protein